jgi:hypothetical protein
MRGAPPGRSGARVLALVLMLAHAVVDASNTTHAMTIGAMPLSPNVVPPNTTLLNASPAFLNGTTSVATLCTGSSTKLAQVQCTAWIMLFDALKGDEWTVCKDARTDPCACTGVKGDMPVCNPGGTTVVNMCVRSPAFPPCSSHSALK